LSLQHLNQAIFTFNPVIVRKGGPMIISKTGTLKTLRILGILCAIAMGFMTLVGTSEDDATDAAGIDDSFNETADIELNPVTASDTDINAALLQPLANNCDTMSVNDALAELEARGDIEDLDNVDISSIKLNYVSGTYSDAYWAPAEVTNFTCSLTITGSQPTISIAETAVNGGSGTIDDTLSTEDIDAINYYLGHRNEEFTYCVVCDDTELEAPWGVTYNVEIGVTIKGDIDVL
jgi:hypothetical protein